MRRRLLSKKQKEIDHIKLLLHFEAEPDDSSNNKIPCVGDFGEYVTGMTNMGTGVNLYKNNRPYYDVNFVSDVFTVEFFIKITSQVNNDWIGAFGSFEHLSEDSSGIAFRYTSYNSSGYNIYFKNSEGVEFSTGWSGSLTTNVWYHFAMVYDGTTFKVYKNGVLHKTVQANGSIDMKRLTFGQWASNNTISNFPGIIDEFCLSSNIKYTSNFNIPDKPIVNPNKINVIRYINNATWTVPSECKKFDLFLVGGGGSGGTWNTWSYTSGGAGGGGGINTQKGLTYPVGTICTLTIGNGGAAGSGYSVSGKVGSDTSVVINDITYSAVGGKGGAAGYKPGTITPTLDDYDLMMGVGGVPGVNNGYVGMSLDGDVSWQLYQNKIVVASTTTYDPINNPTPFTGGIPEFEEQGNKTHACGGLQLSSFKPIGGFSVNSGGVYDNSSENVYIYGGSGFGGGGAAGFYRNLISGAGGKGGVAIRCYF